MLRNNPIILKELIQASHRKWTYIFRAGLPLLAAVLILPQIAVALGTHGQDWRAMAGIARPAFITCVWLEMITFSLLAFLYTTTAIHHEWSHKTLEVLCATPLSPCQILYGKFVAALSKLFMTALALLPVMAVLYYIGRVPLEMVLGSFAVIVGSILLFGATGLMQASAFTQKKEFVSGSISFILPYFVILAMLDIYVWQAHPVLDAALPPRALYLVLIGRGSGALSAGQFALLSLGELCGISLLMLGISPWLFGRTLRRHIGALKKSRRASSLKRILAGKRPRMKTRANPFFWQEKGPRTRALGWAIWIVYGITAVVVIATGLKSPFGFRFLDEDAFWAVISVEGLAVLVLASLFYGTSVFSRERSSRCAQALLLTGRRPMTFLKSKICATYWALRYSLLLVGAACVVLLFSVGRYWSWDEEEICVLAIMVQALLFGPALGVIVGMAFGLVAKSPMRAFLGVVGSAVWGVVMVWVFALVSGLFRMRVLLEPEALLGGAVAVTVVLLAGTRNWKPWRLGLLLALNFYTVIFAIVVAGETFGYNEALLFTLLGSGLTWLITAGWLLMSLRLFGAGMAGEQARLWRRKII